MTTTHQDAAQDYLQQSMADERAASLLSLWARRFAQDPTVQDSFAVFGQTHKRAGRWQMDQMCCAVAMHAFVNAGFYAQCEIPVGAVPGSDRDREGNAASLAALEHPFQAQVDMTQNGAGQDGFLHWTQPIVATRSTGVALLEPQHGETAVVAPRTIGAGRAPLEIGYTLPSRTLAHLKREGRVARWPYDSEIITLVINLPRPVALL